MLKVKRIVDLSVSMFPGMTRPAAICDFEVSHVAKVEKEGFDVSEISMSSHTGTHLDAPMHFIGKGISVDQIRLETVVGEAVVLDLTKLEPRHKIAAAELGRFADRIRPKDIVLLYTGSDKWLDKPEYTTAYPYLGADAARWLVEKKVSTVGIDFLAVDALYKEPLAVDAHLTLLGAGVGIVECLMNLGDIRSERAFFVAAPLKIRDGDASPVRAFAIEFE